MNTIKMFLIAVVAFAGVSCTRKAPDQGPLQISLPQKKISSKGSNGTLSMSLMHVVINVTGSDLSSPMVFNWDGCHGCQTPKPIPESFTMPQDVKSTVEHQIQVLAVYADDDSGQMSFRYGETATAGGSATVPVSPVGTAGATIVSGQISGRYLTGINTGPTGEVWIKYKPQNKPGLIIEKANMVNGWFSFFGLTHADFQYELQVPGQPPQILFNYAPYNGIMSLDRIQPSEKVLMGWYPFTMREEHDEYSNLVYQTAEAQMTIVGYFGPNAADLTGKRVCHNDLNGPSTKYKVKLGNGAGSAMTYSQGTVTKENLTSFFAAGQTQIKWDGGSNDPIATCATGTKYLDYFESLKSFWDGNGDRESSSGFSFPMQWPSRFDNSPVTVIAADGTNKTVTGKLMPNSYQAGIRKIRYYKKEGVSLNGGGDHGDFTCEILESGNSGYAKVAAEATVAADDSFTGGFVSTPALLSGGSTGTSLAMCLINEQGYLLPEATMISAWVLAGSSGGNGPYMRLELQGANSDNNGNYAVMSGAFGGCYEVRLKLYENMGADHYLDGTEVDVDLNGVTSTGVTNLGTFYLSSMCNSSEHDPTFHIPDGNNISDEIYYFKPGSPVTLGTFSGVVSSDLEVQGYTFNTSYNKITIAAGPDITIATPGKMLLNECYQASVFLNLGGQSFEIPAGPSKSFNISATAGTYEFTNNWSDCQNSTSLTNTSSTAGTMTIGGSQNSGQFWIKPLTGTSANLTVTEPVSNVASTPWPLVLGGGSESRAVEKLVMDIPSPLTLGFCTQAYLRALNANGFEIPVKYTRTMNLNYSKADFGFYEAGMCNFGDEISAIDLNPGESSKMFSVRAMKSGGSSYVAFAGGIPVVTPSDTTAGPITANPPSGGAGEVFTYFTAPKLNTTILGSHNFSGGEIEIPIHAPAAAVNWICEYSNDGSIPSVPCDGARWDENSTTLKWLASDSFGPGAKYSLSYDMPSSGGTQGIYFEPGAFYGMGIQPFMVMACDETVPIANSPILSGDLDTSFGLASSAPKIICLDAGVTVTRTTSDTTLQTGMGPGDRALVGYVDLNNPSADPSAVVNMGAGNTTFLETPATWGNIALANLKLYHQSGSTGSAFQNVAVRISVGTGSEFISTGNLYKIDDGATTGGSGKIVGLAVDFPSGNVDIKSVSDRFEMGNNTSNNLYNVLISQLPDVGMLSFFNDKFIVGTTSSSVNGSGLRVNSPNGYRILEVENSSLSGYGTLIHVSNGAAGGSNPFMDLKNVDLHGQGSTTGSVLSLENCNDSSTAVAQLTDVRIKNDNDTPAIRVFDSFTATYDLDLVLRNTIIEQNTDHEAVQIYSSYSGNSMSVDIQAQNTNFIFGGDNMQIPITLTLAGGATLDGSMRGFNSPETGESNRLCSKPSKPIWSTPVGYWWTFGASYNLESPLTLNSPTAAVETDGQWVCKTN